ncbi:MAG: hypothetical protein ABSD67_10520 [Terracidiphilus sp.]|jgi:hypothetical protein
MWKKIKSAFNPNRRTELTTLFSMPDPELQSDYEKAFYAPPVCYSAQFPSVPAPKAHTVPELLAARWIAGRIRPEQTPGIAADLLEAGFDTPSMRRLAGEMRVQCTADVSDLVEKMMNELGVKLPESGIEARKLSTQQIAREVVAGMRNPWTAASELHHLWGHEVWHQKNLAEITQLLEALDSGSIARGTLPQLTDEIIEAFARLGA